MINSLEYSVPADKGGVRLDAALLAAFPSTTRTFVHEAIAAGDIKVDGRHAAKGLKLRGGEKIEIVRLAEASDNKVTPNPEIAVNLVYEDDALLAFDKPCGIAVHPLMRGETGTLMNGVVARFPECIPLGDHPLMAGALHRIDSGTSGLVLVARTQDAFDALRQQFTAKTVEKTYLALVEGNVVDGGTLEHDLAHDPALPYCRMIDSRHNRLTKAQRAKLRPLHAITTYRPIAHTAVENEERTLLEVTIFTGVTHQIRAQLALAGLHIINDRLYGAFAIEDQIGHCLHALRASFSHPISGTKTSISTHFPPWASFASPNPKLR